MSDQDIYFFTTNNQPKSNCMERVKRTLYRLMRHTRTYRYIDDLENGVASYNATPHRGLKGSAPNDVNKNNEADMWARMYFTKANRRIGKPVFKLKKGDVVRTSFTGTFNNHCITYLNISTNYI